MITQIANKPNPNTQSPKVFEETTTNFINNDLPKFVDEANAVSDDVNIKYSDILTRHNDINTKWQDTSIKHSDVVAKWQDVGTKYNQVMNYTIPTNATYDASAIDAMNNTVLTELVRQDLMIQILK